jgi:aminomethyltransferase
MDGMNGEPLKRTPLYAFHVARGARMVAFAGYSLPLQYSGIIKEHLHTRAAASLFDVSHMGQIALRPRSGRIEDAPRALEALMPADLLGLAPGRQRYALFTNEAGGVLDDLMVAHRGDHLALVVNAACKDADVAHLRSCLPESCVVEPLDRALIALQGPKAEDALATLAPGVRSMRFMDVRTVSLLGDPCAVSRSGYTGEDGFEISVAADRAEALCAALLENAAVAPAGLSAPATAFAWRRASASMVPI